MSCQAHCSKDHGCGKPRGRGLTQLSCMCWMGLGGPRRGQIPAAAVEDLNSVHVGTTKIYRTESLAAR